MRGPVRVVQSTAAVIGARLVIQNGLNLILNVIVDEVRGRRRRAHAGALCSAVEGEEIHIDYGVVVVVAVGEVQTVSIGTGRVKDLEGPHAARRKLVWKFAVHCKEVPVHQHEVTGGEGDIATAPIRIGGLTVLGCSQKLLCPSDV
eukprot:jgi/Botrbrau1/16919/Bobra.85_3s0001.1